MKNMNSLRFLFLGAFVMFLFTTGVQAQTYTANISQQQAYVTSKQLVNSEIARARVEEARNNLLLSIDPSKATTEEKMQIALYGEMLDLFGAVPGIETFQCLNAGWGNVIGNYLNKGDSEFPSTVSHPVYVATLKLLE